MSMCASVSKTLSTASEVMASEVSCSTVGRAIVAPQRSFKVTASAIFRRRKASRTEIEKFSEQNSDAEDQVGLTRVTEMSSFQATASTTATKVRPLASRSRTVTM